MSSPVRSPSISPTALFMINCDHVWRDPCNGKVSILGTFNMLSVEQIPFRYPAFAVYLALTDGHGEVQVKLRMIDVDEEFPPIFEITKTFKFPNPHVVVEDGVELPNVPFPRPGEHRLQLFANEELLIERRLHVFGRQQNQPGQSDI